MLATLLSALLLPQSQQNYEAPPQGLTIVIVDVGQGDGAVIRTPDGTLHVVDGGPNGTGNAAIIPVINALAPARFGAVFLSHYHTDHMGGLDEVLARPFTTVYDRGDVARPSNTDMTNYLNASGARRRAVATGEVIALGGGVTMTVISHNGVVTGLGTIPVAGTAQEENSRSVALRLDYRSFSMWFGGDLTGGGNSTADVETTAAQACGNVDVYRVNHHGSNTSTNINFVTRLAPEVALFSCGLNNPYGYPPGGTLNRLNQGAAARVLLSTTEGTGAIGFGAAGNITLQTDGLRYRTTSRTGKFLDMFVDEATRPPTASDLKISEVHRNPGVVPDTNGEYLELTNIGAAPVSLRNVQISGRGGTFTVFTNLMLLPGRPVLLGPDGNPTRNGSLPLGFAWPYQSLSLDDTTDTLALRSGSTTLDQLSYSTGFSGGSGIAAERMNQLGPTLPTNYAPATQVFGPGDRGTPAAKNSTDATAHPARVAVWAAPTEVVIHASALSHPGKLSVVALALGSSPGFPFLNAQIPLNPDPLFQLTLPLPGFAATLPAEGYRSTSLPLPANHPLRGQFAYAAHIVIELGPPTSVAAVSTATQFQFP